MTLYPQAATLQTADDRHLISQIAKQDRAAFEALYRRYYRRIFQFAMRRVWREELAEEVVSDVMFAVWQHAASFEGASSVSTWLLGITYRQALKALERNRKHAVVDSNDELLAETVDPDPAMDPESAAVMDSEHAWVQKGIDTLAEHHRVVVELTATGHSYGEIAQIIGCPENTVKTRMFHARLQLKRFLIEAGNAGQAFGPGQASRLAGKRS
jgi:RNA polymerase sigma-70 factor (ECF subfamily)